METPDKLKWLFGERLDVKEILLTVAAVLIIIGFVT